MFQEVTTNVTTRNALFYWAAHSTLFAVIMLLFPGMLFTIYNVNFTAGAGPLLMTRWWGTATLFSGLAFFVSAKFGNLLLQRRILQYSALPVSFLALYNTYLNREYRISHNQGTTTAYFVLLHWVFNIALTLFALYGRHPSAQPTATTTTGTTTRVSRAK